MIPTSFIPLVQASLAYPQSIRGRNVMGVDYRNLISSPSTCFAVSDLTTFLHNERRTIPPTSSPTMAGARRSARQAAKSNSSPGSSQGKPAPSAGSKRKADSKNAPKAKRGKKGDDKEQTTIEASMPVEGNNGANEDVAMEDVTESKPAEASDRVDEVAKREEEIRDQEDMRDEQNDESNAEKKEPETNGSTNNKTEEKPGKNGFDAIMNQDTEDKNVTAEGTGSKVPAAENAVEDSSEREEATPSNILEKGIIYFFFRGRVGINEPSDVNDIARSYIILRPMPHGAKLGEGPIGDVGNVRMLSLPKKVLPVSPKDRFMTFVEKANVSLEDGMCSLKQISSLYDHHLSRKPCYGSRVIFKAHAAVTIPIIVEKTIQKRQR